MAIRGHGSGHAFGVSPQPAKRVRPRRRYQPGRTDAVFSHAFDEVFRTECIRVIRTPVEAPNANAYAERWVRTLRGDCLDRILILGRSHPRGRPELCAGLESKATVIRIAMTNTIFPSGLTLSTARPVDLERVAQSCEPVAASYATVAESKTVSLSATPVTNTFVLSGLTATDNAADPPPVGGVSRVQMSVTNVRLGPIDGREILRAVGRGVRAAAGPNVSTRGRPLRELADAWCGRRAAAPATAEDLAFALVDFGGHGWFAYTRYEWPGVPSTLSCAGLSKRGGRDGTRF
jgi:hypothetical protein